MHLACAKGNTKHFLSCILGNLIWELEKNWHQNEEMIVYCTKETSHCFITLHDLWDNKRINFTGRRIDKYKAVNDLWLALLQINKPLGGAVIRSMNAFLHGDFFLWLHFSFFFEGYIIKFNTRYWGSILLNIVCTPSK